MDGKLLCAFALLSSATTLRADVFSFSFSGTGVPGSVNASGTITATAGIGGIYTITGLSGLQNGKLISLYGSGNTITFSGSSAVGTLEFLVSGQPNGPDIVSFSGKVFSESGVTGADTGANFQITRGVPEVSTAALLLTMGLGVWVLARRLPAKKNLRT